MGRTFGGKDDRSFALSGSHDRSVSNTRKNISIVDLGCLLGLERTSDSKSSSHSLLIIENTEIGFLVESVVGVEPLRLCQNSDPLSKLLIQNVYLCNNRDELVLGLDVPRLLSIC